MARPTLRIPRWREFQHYKDRSAPWIKAYRELLLDDEWHELADSSKGHVFGLWLLAANYEGKIPFKPTWISRQIGANTAIDWRELAKSKWVALNASASDVLAELYGDASLRALAREGEGYEEEGDPPLIPLTGDGSNGSHRKEKTEVPEDWLPTADLIAWSTTNHPLVDWKQETPKFIRNARARGARYKRIGLAWQNWISGKFVGKPQSTQATLRSVAPLKAE